MAADFPQHVLRHWRTAASPLVLATALFFASGQPAAAAEFRDRSVIGNWKLVAVLDLASIASLDAAEAKTLLGKTLAISATDVKVDQEVCHAPEFWAERVMPESHMQAKLHSSAQRLRLPNPVTMIELGCTDVYVRNPAQLVLLWGGAMFDAVRIAPRRRQRTADVLAGKPQAGNARSTKRQEAGKLQQTSKLQTAGKAGSAGKARETGSVRKTGTARKKRTSPHRPAGNGAPGTFANELF